MSNEDEQVERDEMIERLRDVACWAQWWATHPGAPGKKLIASLGRLESGELGERLGHPSALLSDAQSSTPPG